MKKTKLINSEISYEISKIGHTQMLCISDSGFPVPRTTRKIDIALTNKIPTFLQGLDSVLEELCVEKVILAEEIKSRSPELLEKILERFDNIPVEYISHNDFKKLSGDCEAIIRTGEIISFANIILVAGVTF
ncbi:D-ribose pyranase [Vallitalea longa]|uniref:D-ribose pyranase n=1 Tax=Vallitalea longa TaxID=2936439 RepID=A0A9W5Y8X1_9FIRM|nr:D-ribose pyranase [Vallitalea longa]GKX28221.1 D-ribose pyranase [Vallitalea longa]